MKKLIRPIDGWPWEKRDPPFSIDWPPNFVPSDRKAGQRSPQELSRIAAKARDVQLQNGHTGAMIGLSRASDQRLEQMRDQQVRKAGKK